jgi:hypothetical protein
MSYFVRLMAQTGIDLVRTAAPAHPVPASPLVEIEVQQGAPAATPVQDEPPAGVPQPAPPDVARPPRYDRAPDGVATAPLAAVQGAPVAASAPAAPATRATAAEPLIPEIVIEQRPAGTSPPQPGMGQQPVRAAVPEPAAALAPRLQQRDEPAHPGRQPDTSHARPTFLEIRNWVAMTPAADATHGPAEVAQPEAPGVAMPPEPTTGTRAAWPAPQAVPEPVLALGETQVELSIGTMQVIVEAPPAPIQPARPLAPPAAPAAASSGSRLSRRYLRP